MTALGSCLDEHAALAFLQGSMPAEELAAIDRHIGECKACRQLLRVLTSLEDAERVAPAEPAPASPASIDRYTVVGEHARGGQARVLIAFDENVGRKVALKELLPGASGSPASDARWREASARFLREAELTGQLVHPGVVPVFEIGKRPDGALFYTMQLVRGRTLSEVLRERSTLPDRLALLSHFLSVCHVVAYAHSRGIVHRDIKPQNIMVGDFGESVLLDWGLAKQQGERESAPLGMMPAGANVPEALTLEGTAVGTPGYMSPEQASGRLSEVDERSDVYGLGAVLFEILIGKPPPVPAYGTPGSRERVRALCPNAPPELAGVAEKALAPEKRDRYQKAAELAQDVTAFMTGGRVAAYAYTSRDLIRRFALRHRLLLGSVAIVFAAIATALVFTSLAWRSERESRRSATAEGQSALQEGASLALLQGDRLQARAKLRGALELGDSLTARTLWRRLREDPERFVSNFGSQVTSARFSPSGRELAVGLLNGNVQFIDVVTRAIRRSLRGTSSEQVAGIAFRPDGELLASAIGTGRIALWDVEQETSTEIGSEGAIPKALAFSPDGSLLAAANFGPEIVLWKTHERRLEAKLPTPGGRVTSVAFSHDGRYLAGSNKEGNAIVWDLRTQRPALVVPGPVTKAVFAPEGGLLIAARSDGSLLFWRIESGQLERVMRCSQAWISGLAASPNGRLLATASLDGVVRLWSLPTGDLLRVMQEHLDVVYELAFSPDSNLLAAADGTAWVWDLSFPVPPAETVPPSRGLESAHFSQDGLRIASAGTDGMVHLWDISGKLRASWAEHQGTVKDVCFSPDGRLLASAGYDGFLVIQEVETGTVHHRLSVGDRLWSVSCAPDNRHVVSGGYDGVIRIWDLESGKLVRVLESRTRSVVTALRYFADGKRLLVGRSSGVIEKWNAGSGRLLSALLGHTEAVTGLVLDSSERFLASSSNDRSARLWKLSDGTSQLLTETPGRIMLLDWDSRNGGNQIALPLATGEIAVQDLDRGRSFRFRAHRAELNSIEFAPDGKTAVSAGDDGVLRLWDSASWQPKWFTLALARLPEPQILTQRGWLALDSSRRFAPVASPAGTWRTAMEGSRAASMQPGGPACLAGKEGLEVWDIARDVRVAMEKIEPPFELEAKAGGCSVLKNGRMVLYRPGAAPMEVADNVDSQSGGEELVAIGSGVELFDTRGQSMGRFGSGSKVTAAAFLGMAMAVGFSDGSIELRTPRERIPIFFQEPPGAAVTQMVAGPAGTLIAGFANGAFGIWNTGTGVRLERAAVHGAVQYLVMHDQILIAASEVGAIATMDLSVLTADYCALLEEVRSRVPILWHDQGAVVEPPRPGHRCSQRHSLEREVSPIER